MGIFGRGFGLEIFLSFRVQGAFIFINEVLGK